MLTIRGADQVATSLRAARKSLGDGRATPQGRIEALDLIIGELAVGAPTFIGNAEKSKVEIESLVSSLAPPAASADHPQESLPPGLDNALGHFRRAVATLERHIASEHAASQ